jgi:hypothetical protein
MVPRAILTLYHVAVSGSSLFWTCPVYSVMVPLYNRYLKESSSHLDIGPGSGVCSLVRFVHCNVGADGTPGFFTAHSSTIPLLNKLKRFTFLDASPNCLRFSSERAVASGYRGPEIELCEQNIFEPIPDHMNGAFDTVALFWVLHCLPGAFPDKASRAVETILPALAPSPTSTLYGTTLLGPGVKHSRSGQYLLKFFRDRNIFSNQQDNEAGLRAGLEPYFDEVTITVVGANACFVCRGPKQRPVN